MRGLSVVKFERLRRGKKVQEVAEAAGVKPQKYRVFEGGDRYRYLNDSELEGVAECLRISRDMIADDRGAPRMMA